MSPRAVGSPLRELSLWCQAGRFHTDTSSEVFCSSFANDAYSWSHSLNRSPLLHAVAGALDGERDLRHEQHNVEPLVVCIGYSISHRLQQPSVPGAAYMGENCRSSFNVHWAMAGELMYIGP